MKLCSSEISIVWFKKKMGPNIRLLAELIHDVYGFPLEPIEDDVISSKGLDIEKTAKNKVKQREVKTTPGKGKADMDNLLPIQHTGAKCSVPKSKEYSLEEDEEVGEEADVVVGKGKSDEEEGGRGAESTGRRTNPISRLKQRSAVNINVEGVQTTESNVMIASEVRKEREASKKKVMESGHQDEYARQEMPQTKPGVGAEETGVDAEEVLQSSDQERFEGTQGKDDDCAKSLPIIVSRTRMRSSATSGEETFKFKVSCQMEGEIEIVDADILLTPSSRRSRGQVKTLKYGKA